MEEGNSVSPHQGAEQESDDIPSEPRWGLWIALVVIGYVLSDLLSDHEFWHVLPPLRGRGLILPGLGFLCGWLTGSIHQGARLIWRDRGLSAPAALTSLGIAALVAGLLRLSHSPRPDPLAESWPLSLFTLLFDLAYWQLLIPASIGIGPGIVTASIMTYLHHLLVRRQGD
jgi:hypothetical protein